MRGSSLALALLGAAADGTAEPLLAVVAGGVLGACADGGDYPVGEACRSGGGGQRRGAAPRAVGRAVLDVADRERLLDEHCVRLCEQNEK